MSSLLESSHHHENQYSNLGVGAIVSFQIKFLHPKALRDEKYPPETLQKGQRFTNAIVVRQEIKKINHKDREVVVVHHEDFKDDQGRYHVLWCSKSHIRIEKEGDPKNFFDKETVVKENKETRSTEKTKASNKSTNSTIHQKDGSFPSPSRQEYDNTNKTKSGLSLSSHVDKFKMELLLRILLTTIFGCILSVSTGPNIANVIPPTSAYMIGILGPVLGVSLPHVMFVFLGLFPTIIVLMIVAVGFSSMLLACLNVSVGLMVAMYAIYVLFITSFFFGKLYKLTSALPALFCAIPAMLATSFQPLLENPDLGLTVSELWKQSGVDNPAAVFRNFLILIGWALLVILVGILLPIPRTARQTFSSKTLPPIIEALAMYIQQDEEPENDERLIGQITNMCVSIHGNAVMTTFEPRIWRNENLVKPLNTLFESVERMSQVTMLKFVNVILGGESSPETIKLLQLSAKALQTNDIDDYAAVKAYDGSDLDPEDGVNTRSFLTEVSLFQAKAVRHATLIWLKDLNGASSEPKNAKESLQNIIRNNLWITAPLMPFTRLVAACTLPFNTSRWNLRSILWSFEYGMGYVILFILSTYVDGYRNLGIGTDNALYRGWNLMGYANSWRPTLEGTVKKGLSRMFGTMFGGFWGWLGVIVCSGSYDESAPMNPYGTVAWITVFTVSASFFGIESGPSSLFGDSKDHGYPVLYFIVTQNLVMLDVYSGSGIRDAVTVNRIVATVTGVLLAIFISIIPPSVRGNDPQSLQTCCRLIESAFVSMLDALSAADAGHDFDVNREEAAHAKEEIDLCMFRAQDANQLSNLDLLKLEPRIIPLLQSMIVTHTFLSQLIDGGSKIAKDNTYFLNDHAKFFDEIRLSLTNDKDPEGKAIEEHDTEMKLKKVAAFDTNDAVLFITKILVHRMKDHKAVVAEIKAIESKGKYRL